MTASKAVASSELGELVALEEVTASWVSKYAPIQYHSFDVGPFYCKTTVKPGETTEEAMARAFDVCLKAARAAYPLARDAFLANAKDAAEVAKGRR
jgi:hypothetical protein